ncbi:MAG: MFS transporter [Planctomycetota bacterium]
MSLPVFNADSPQKTAKVATRIEKSFLWNASLLTAGDGIWALGASFTILLTIVPAYLLNLGASKTLVQVVMVGFPLFSIIQVFSSRVVHGRKRRQLLFKVWFWFVLSWVLYGAAAYFWWESLPQGTWLLLFLLMCLGVAVSSHLGVPAGAEMYYQNMPLKRRGRLGAMRGLSFGLCGIAGSQAAAWVMTRWPAPAGFHLGFVIGGLLYLVSIALTFTLFRDHARLLQEKENGPLSPLEIGRTLWKHFNFRVFLVFYMLFAAAQNLGPMLIGYGKDVVGIPPGDVAQFTALYFIGATLVGTLVPLLADRFGFRLIAIITAALSGLAFLFPIIWPGSFVMLLVAYGCYAGSNQLGFLVLFNLGPELVPNVRPAKITAIATILVMPLSLCLAPLGGLLVDLHGAKGGYLAVFVLGTALALCALIGFAAVTREPRTGQELHIRIRRP